MMNSVLQHGSLGDLLTEWLFYVFTYGLIAHSFICLCGCLLIFGVSRVGGANGLLPKRIIHFTGFMVILLVVGGAFNALWTTRIWGSLYRTFGADTDNDFTPFAPLSVAEFNDEQGQLMGITFHQLQLVWFFFAAMAWGISFILYRLIVSAGNARKGKSRSGQTKT